MSEPTLVGGMVAMGIALGSVSTILAKGIINKRNGSDAAKCAYHDDLIRRFERFEIALSDPEKGISVQLARLNQHMEFILKARKDD